MITTSSPSGTPYHRLRRCDLQHRWWRPLVVGLVATGLYLASLVVVLGVLVAVGLAVPSVEPVVDRAWETDLDPTNPVALAMLLGLLALMLPALLLAERLLAERPTGAHPRRAPVVGERSPPPALARPRGAPGLRDLGSRDGRVDRGRGRDEHAAGPAGRPHDHARPPGADPRAGALPGRRGGVRSSGATSASSSGRGCATPPSPWCCPSRCSSSATATASSARSTSGSSPSSAAGSPGARVGSRRRSRLMWRTTSCCSPSAPSGSATRTPRTPAPLGLAVSVAMMAAFTVLVTRRADTLGITRTRPDGLEGRSSATPTDLREAAPVL